MLCSDGCPEPDRHANDYIDVGTYILYFFLSVSPHCVHSVPLQQYPEIKHITHAKMPLTLLSISNNVQVAWMHFEQSAILTVHNHVITRNPRISVTHDKHDKYRTWYLHIKNVHEEDKGRYMCQINTVVAKTQFGYVHVVGEYCFVVVGDLFVENEPENHYS